MVIFPNAKINFGLDVISKREDGYHNISSLFYPIRWSDALEIIPSKKVQFTLSGLPISGNTDDNLCIKAFRLLEQNYDIEPVHIHLHKVIPMGAGLGGGSSDGAFTLKLLNQLFELNIPIEKLQYYAAQLGSDCTFFIENKPALVSGVGDELELIDFNLKRYQLMVIYPEIHIPTQLAYQRINPEMPAQSIKEILSLGVLSFKSTLKNDFEKSISNSEISEIKSKLYEQGAVYASMTGSGSAVYGLFSKDKDLSIISKPFGSNLIWIE